MSTKVHAFVVMPFGSKPDAEGHLIHFDRVYTDYIRPALVAAGFEVFRADEETSAGEIRKDMFQELLMADPVVADITINNPNVWYELGVRHALRARGVVLIWVEDRGPSMLGPIANCVTPCVMALPTRLPWSRIKKTDDHGQGDHGIVARTQDQSRLRLAAEPQNRTGVRCGWGTPLGKALGAARGLGESGGVGPESGPGGGYPGPGGGSAGGGPFAPRPGSRPAKPCEKPAISSWPWKSWNVARPSNATISERDVRSVFACSAWPFAVSTDIPSIAPGRTTAPYSRTILTIRKPGRCWEGWTRTPGL